MWERRGSIGFRCQQDFTHPANKHDVMRKKRIGRAVLYRLRHEYYLNTILNYNTIYQIRMNAIWADKTLLYKVDQRKIAFHSLETKRYTRRCAIHTYAFGSVKIEIGNRIGLENKIWFLGNVSVSPLFIITMSTAISRQYFNPKLPGSFSELPRKTSKNRKLRDKRVVEEVLNKLKAYSLHKPAAKIYPRRRVFAPFKDYQWFRFVRYASVWGPKQGV
jgi:hypothetical protein